MPKLTLLLGRRTVQVYDFAQPAIQVGRGEGMDITIDNPSVSRKHAVIRQDGDRWIVADLGSSNGTFLNGDKIAGGMEVKEGDEIGMGKFSIIFGKALGDVTQSSPVSAPMMGEGHRGTMQIKTHELEQLLSDSSEARKAHVDWEAGGQRGTHTLADTAAVLIGTSNLCDIVVPRGPKFILIVRGEKGTDIRNLSGGWTKMRVKGTATNKTFLKDGDEVECAGLTLKFVDDLG
jgi:pSer/pThr/pTyr-binding forkhead associated (FHA) protein